MSHDQPRVAVLGAGEWGRNHVRTWHSLGVLAMVCDPDPGRREEVRGFGVEVVADTSAVIGRDDIDVVVVATPVPTHHDLAIAAMRAGHDVLVEKPLAMDLAGAEEVVRVAEETGTVLAVGHVLEYHPAVRRLDSLLREGALGELLWMTSHRLSLGQVRTAEDVLWSFAPHDIAMLLRLTGRPPELVTGRRRAFVTAGVADVAFCGLTFPGGVEGQIVTSWLHPFKEHRLVVVGREAMAVFDDTKPSAEKLLLQPYVVEHRQDGHPPTSLKGDPIAVEIDDVLPLTEECRHFLHRVADRQRPLTDGRSALDVLRVLAAADRSAAEGGAPVAPEPSQVFG
ncbi:MAG: Gfo/Idh/MocA family oxidoreductase [Acidimicrobiales bacterium]